jgi:predicted nucleic acid-binding protein
MRYVIAPDTALRLLGERTAVPAPTRLVAPTLLRSQILSELYGAVRRGKFGRAEGRARLDHMRTLDIRLLGDRVLQRLAWDIAERLGWADTLTAEYLALTKLQADAFVTLDADLALAVDGIVPLASFEQMLAGQAPPSRERV